MERALERALGMLSSDAVVEPVIREGLTVDRDTKGVTIRLFCAKCDAWEYLAG